MRCVYTYLTATEQNVTNNKPVVSFYSVTIYPFSLPFRRLLFPHASKLSEEADVAL